jgi:molecular chaperone IbpA
MAMAIAFDYSPLFRSSIGFDRVLNLLENASKIQAIKTWPPYDIIKTGDDSYRVVLAVPGFDEADIELTYQPNLLVVSGNKVNSGEGDYLHRGIGSNAFEHRFELAEHVRVASAEFEKGLLSVDLVREIPEAMKPRRIAINSTNALGGSEPVQIEEQKAA